MRFATIVILALTSACLSPAQTQPSFEAAAIHPDTVGAGPGTGFDFNGASLRVTNATLQYLICSAYRIQGDQIVGGPAWVHGERYDSDRYDIDAKTGGTEKISRDLFRTMLQNLLADRFGLKTHRETRQMTVFVLVADKGGTKLREDTEGGGNRLNTDRAAGKAVLTGTRVSMEQFSGYIGDKLSRVVIDKTELKRVYDFTLEWDPEQSPGDTGPSMFTGLREQLGLRLESQKTAVDVLVIDSVARPSEN
jgi:uncharacterized protein (TIGR03435 family)